MTDAMNSPIGCSNSRRMTFLTPRLATLRPYFDRAVFIEGDHPSVLRRVPPEPVNAFFFEANSGSVLSFQVLVR